MNVATTVPLFGSVAWTTRTIPSLPGVAQTSGPGYTGSLSWLSASVQDWL